MRPMLLAILVSLPQAGFAASPTPNPTTPQPAAGGFTAEVKRQVDQFTERWNRHDMKAFAELFASDAEFVNVVGIWWKGREEIYQAHQFTHSNMFKSSRLTVLETTVRSPKDGITIARSRWRLEGHTAPDGSVLPPRTGLLVNILQRRESGWLIIDSQNTHIIDGVLSRPQ